MFKTHAAGRNSAVQPVAQIMRAVVAPNGKLPVHPPRNLFNTADVTAVKITNNINNIKNPLSE
jgi:hypothetical protein